MCIKSFILTGSKISNAAQPGRDCAVMRVREQFIDDVYCNDTYNLVICELKGMDGSLFNICIAQVSLW